MLRVCIVACSFLFLHVYSIVIPNAQDVHPLAQGSLRNSSNTSNVTLQDNSTSGAVPSGRQNVVLPDDGPDSQYTVSDFDCLDVYNDFNQTCWSGLNMNVWLQAWHDSTPACIPGHNTASCLQQNEPWTAAFLRNYGTAMDCIHIGQGCAYTAANGTGANDPPLLRARYTYARYTIISVGVFFNSWSNAMDMAMSQAQALVPNMVDLIDKPHQTMVWFQDLMAVLDFAFAFIPGAGPEISILAALSQAVIVDVITAIKKYPSVARVFWPAGTADSQRVQTDALTAQFSNPGAVRNQVHNNVGLALQLAQGVNQTNVTSFLAFAGNGAFTMPLDEAPNIKATQPSDILGLLQAITTYLVSTILDQNKWRALVLPGVNPVGLHNGSSTCPFWFNDGCSGDKHRNLDCINYDENGLGQGTYWWYSEAHQSTYTIIKENSVNNDAKDFLKKIFENEWTTGQLLFENAAICEYQGLFDPSQNAQYTMDPDRGAGMIYTGSNVVTDPLSHQLNGTTKFLPLNGPGLVRLSESKKYGPMFEHPSTKGTATTAFSFTPGGFDLRCVSQLTTSVANSWKSKNWMANNKRNLP